VYDLYNYIYKMREKGGGGGEGEEGEKKRTWSY
jgi:hypothetical protein